jgi:hypothetical protein
LAGSVVTKQALMRLILERADESLRQESDTVALRLG